jgi:hypothetical protein
MRSALVFILLAATICTGYVWYRSNAAEVARGSLRLSLPGQPHLIPWPQRHWRYGPESESTSQPHLAETAGK